MKTLSKKTLIALAIFLLGLGHLFAGVGLASEDFSFAKKDGFIKIEQIEKNPEKYIQCYESDGITYYVDVESIGKVSEDENFLVLQFNMIDVSQEDDEIAFIITELSFDKNAKNIYSRNSYEGVYDFKGKYLYSVHYPEKEIIEKDTVAYDLVNGVYVIYSGEIYDQGWIDYVKRTYLLK